MCVDFTDLNKVCPKDNYLLPKIDKLVDATAGHHAKLYRCILVVLTYSFVHRRLGKDFFHNQLGTILQQGNALWAKKCRVYLLMPGKQIFEPILRKTVELYVDDMIVKTCRTQSMIGNCEGRSKSLKHVT